tara:strand:+ start:41 stop:229 length:189 start_codon:yes stop_codon:yes gene_type:complete
MNLQSDGSQPEKNFLAAYVASNPELYMGDQIRENVNAPGDKSMKGKVSNNVRQKIRDGVIKV